METHSQEPAKSYALFEGFIFVPAKHDLHFVTAYSEGDEIAAFYATSDNKYHAMLLGKVGYGLYTLEVRQTPSDEERAKQAWREEYKDLRTKAITALAAMRGSK